MIETAKAATQLIAGVLETVAIAFILVGAAGAVLIYLKKTLSRKADYRAVVESRSYLGHALSLALEFLIGADILRTVISPTWDDIGKLAAVVGIRVLLNFFLMRELKQAEPDLTRNP